MSILETVKQICAEEAKTIPGAQIIAPLPVWDNAHGSMGVQIKAPQSRGGQRCEVTASFVLKAADLKTQSLIRLKAVTAVNAINHDVQVKIVPVKPVNNPDALRADSQRIKDAY